MTLFSLFLFQYWFQNRRAKSRKLTREMTPSDQSIPSNQFEPNPVSRIALPRKLQFVANASDSDHWKHATCVSYQYPPLAGSVTDQQYSRMFTPARHHPVVQLNQLRHNVSFPFVMSNSTNQFKVRRAELARFERRGRRSLRISHPYWTPY